VVVLPVPKISNLAGFSDFRPISLLPCLSKVCEVLMAVQLNEFWVTFSISVGI
jgi:hypothetical protein